MTLRPALVTLPALAAILIAGSTVTTAADDTIAVTNLDVLVNDNPLLPGSAAALVASVRAGGAELGVLVLSKNRLHHHQAQDHVLYVARGEGTARLESATGQIESRPIKPGDILSLPRGRKHGFEKSGREDLVFLVVATPLPPGVEETTYHE
jgi:mannose-6-phosphate isomerase-like protein (cupin superfamily)